MTDINFILGKESQARLADDIILLKIVSLIA